MRCLAISRAWLRPSEDRPEQLVELLAGLAIECRYVLRLEGEPR